jgi:hypothetical protein
MNVGGSEGHVVGSKVSVVEFNLLSYYFFSATFEAGGCFYKYLSSTVITPLHGRESNIFSGS